MKKIKDEQTSPRPWQPAHQVDSPTTPIRFTEGRTDYWDERTKQWKKVDSGKARIYYSDGRVEYWDDQPLAYAVWLALPKGVRAAFRGVNDTRPVYPWDCVDKLPGRGP